LLLQQVAQRLKSCTRESDLVARLGGDEFAILQGEISEPANAGELAAKIQTALALPFLINNNEVKISVSIGISPIRAGTAGADAMLVQADLALYRSKDEGRNQYHFHSADLDQEVLDRCGTLPAKSKEPSIQANLSFSTSRRSNYRRKILSAWKPSSAGTTQRGACSPPGSSFRLPRRPAQLSRLGHWVLDQACRQMSLWRNEGLNLP
jgi:predicted signal transduction protein with EAL and GGDEF domain